MVAFAAESADDVNLLLGQFRTNMNLRVNVVQVDGATDMRNYTPNENMRKYLNDHKREFDFKYYVSELFSAPAPIAGYLCKQYNLHKIPVFGLRAETHTQKLVNELQAFGCNVFFVGEVFNKTIRSRYGSGAISTSSNRVISRKWLHMSTDKAQIKEVESDLNKFQTEHAELHNKIRQYVANQKNAERSLESKKKDIKELQQKLQYKKVLKGKLGAKIDQMRNFEKEVKGVNVERERSRIDKEKRHHLSETVRLTADLKNLLGKLRRLTLYQYTITVNPLYFRRRGPYNLGFSKNVLFILI